MGPGGISIGSLLLILAIVMLVFGTKKLKNLGGDLGGAIKGFKKAMADEPGKEPEENAQQKSIGDKPAEGGNVYDVKPEAGSTEKPKTP